MMDNKIKYGQFYTKNYNYILKGITPIKKEGIEYIEPFCGEGDLIKWICDKHSINKDIINSYDIEPKYENCIKKDTLKTPPNYFNKFIFTNPPYLALNKNKDKTIYKLYNENDLYKCFIRSFLIPDKLPIGGILIIPLNFWSDINKKNINLRKDFLHYFLINNVSVFNIPVFEDTSYTVCSFKFTRKEEFNNNKQNIKFTFYPSENEKDILFSKELNWSIGGEIYKLKPNKDIKIERLTRKNIEVEGITNILVKCIDDTNKLGLKIVSDEERYIDNTKALSARSYATLIINPILTLEQQEKLVYDFNKYIKTQREKYNSLFLTNYREGERKRISFKLVYRIVSYLLSNNF